MNREILVRAFFFAALLFLLAQLYDVLSPFLKPIAWSILLAIVFQPVHEWLLRVTGGRRTPAALLVTLAIVLLVALPATGLSTILAGEAAGFMQELSHLSESGTLATLYERVGGSRLGRLLDEYAPWFASLNLDLAGMARTAVTAAGNTIVGYLGDFARNVASLVLNLFVVLFTVFFLFRDGDRLIATLRALVPMQEADKERVLSRLRGMIEAVVRGMMVTAAVQGVLTGVGLLIAGVPYAAFLSTLSAALSLFPFGAGIVWIVCSIYLFAVGAVGKGIFLVLWGALVVSSIDNFVRPILIGGQAKISTLFLFFGMIGGIEAYGILGLFLGPALMAALTAFVEIYREEYVLSAEDPPPERPMRRSRVG